jgi:dTDP-4-dehydrorhamnose 3,5-epimerase
MQFRPTQIPDVIAVEPRVFGDKRGFFLETWERRKFAAGGIDVDFVQDNHSASGRHVMRGLHYQLARPQGKLVRVTVGEVFDVAVDLRFSSPTFGKWVGFETGIEKTVDWYLANEAWWRAVLDSCYRN